MQLIKVSSGRFKALSPAKVNLFLEVLYKRKDGYHEIESIMQTIALFDTLYFAEPKRSPRSSARSASAETRRESGA
ncbi:MAG: hypothetical protein QME16_03945, partial [Planctomycetota bacterium]|nr:hypothetical protein [Planctomycetota bacterium]